MVMTVLQRVPRLLPLAADTAFDCTTDAFISGQLVGVQAGGAAASLYGAAYSKTEPKKAATLVLPTTDISVVAGGVGFSATRDSNGNATNDLTIVFGTADGQVIDAIPARTGASDTLLVSVWVNGVLQQRIADGGNPAPGQFARSSTSGGRTLVIGASSSSPIRAGSTIVVALAIESGQLAVMNASGQFVDGGPVAAGSLVERRIGLAKSTVDTAGRAGSALIEADVIVPSADVALVTITK